MNQKQKEILEGCLLGDGCIIKAKKAKNAYFSYTSSQKEHCEFVSSNFLEFAKGTVYELGPLKRKVYDKRTNKTYTSYVFRTRSLPEFTKIYHLWYINRIKIIPLCLVLNKIHCLYWYIGDGCLLRNSRNKRSEDIKLATYCFTVNDNQFLCNQLIQFKARINYNENNLPYIRIRKRESKTFLEYIGNNYPSCYAYKWDYSPYINKQPVFTSEKLFTIIQQDYVNGESAYALFKKYNVAINSIKNHLRKSNLYIPKDMKKVICQYDLNNNLIKTWNSGQEIKKQLNFNASAISKCCRGERKKYKNFIWKFKK